MRDTTTCAKCLAIANEEADAVFAKTGEALNPEQLLAGQPCPHGAK